MSIKNEMKISAEEIEKMLSEMEDIKHAEELERQRQVQMKICENIKSKVAKIPTMQLEQEEILEDNSVLLTIRV